MSLAPELENNRLLLYYKGDISALVMYAQHANGSICWPTPLPTLSSILEEDDNPELKISVHPALLIKEINTLLKLDDDLLKCETGFHQYVDTPQGIIAVHMARFLVLDPPHKLMQSLGFRMRTLPELRGRPPTEMELLRRAYVKVMES